MFHYLCVEMGRNTEISAVSRVEEFREHGFYLSVNKNVLCKYCNTRIEWKRRDACSKHIKSKGHMKRLEETAKISSAPKRQLTIETSLQVQKKAKCDKVEFIMDTTEMFVKVRLLPYLIF